MPAIQTRNSDGYATVIATVTTCMTAAMRRRSGIAKSGRGKRQDDCNIFEQQDGKAGATTIARHQALFVQRLQNDSGRR